MLTRKKTSTVSFYVHCDYLSFARCNSDGYVSYLDHQGGSIWLFTVQKFEGSRPFTVQANYEGFSEGNHKTAN